MLEAVKKRFDFRPGAGFVETGLDGVRFFWSTQPVERAPLIYNAGIVIILQGSKMGWLGDHVFTYDPQQYLVLTVPLPFDCATCASPEEPLLGLFIDFSRVDIAEIIAAQGDSTARARSDALAVAPARVEPEMADATRRLLSALSSDITSKVLGPGIVREITFCALNGPHGDALRALAGKDTHLARLSAVIAGMRQNYTHTLRVDDLAQDAGMSPALFFRSFKTVTGISPHQYIKMTRLHRAKGMILAEGLSVTDAARRVGFESVPHFSREFKKVFKVSPKAAQMSGYTPIDV